MYAVSTRGKTKGVKMLPHLHADGMYVVSMERFKQAYVRVPTLADVERYVRLGYGARMSATGGRGPANLYAAASITL